MTDELNPYNILYKINWRKGRLLQNIFSVGSEERCAETEKLLFAVQKGRAVAINSPGTASIDGYWYDQTEDEWVLVLAGEGEIEWSDGSKKLLHPGDSVFIPAHEKHRVSYASSKPPCVWLAIYGCIDMEEY